MTNTDRPTQPPPAGMAEARLTTTDRPTRQMIDRLHREVVDAAISLAQKLDSATVAAYAMAESAYHRALDRVESGDVCGDLVLGGEVGHRGLRVLAREARLNAYGMPCEPCDGTGAIIIGSRANARAVVCSCCDGYGRVLPEDITKWEEPQDRT